MYYNSEGLRMRCGVLDFGGLIFGGLIFESLGIGFQGARPRKIKMTAEIKVSSNKSYTRPKFPKVDWSSSSLLRHTPKEIMYPFNLGPQRKRLFVS